MSNTGPNGIIYPDENSTDWYDDITSNLTALDAVKGKIETHVNDTDKHLGDGGVAPKATSDADGNTITATYATKTELGNKQNALSASQLSAVNSGIDSTKVAQIATNTTNIATKANDADVVHLSGAETIGGVKDFSECLNHNVTLATGSDSGNSVFGTQATITYSDGTTSKTARLNLRVLSDGTKALYPHVTADTTLGLASRRWSEVYANAYYLGTTNFTDKFVTTDTGQTISGVKTFSASNITISNASATTYAYRVTMGGVTFGTAPSASVTSSFRTTDKDGNIVFDIMGQAQANGQNTITFRSRNSDGTTNYDRRLQWTVRQNGTVDFKPSDNAVADLGTTSNKWATINGINPGALSLPNLNSYVDISSNITDITGKWGSDANFYTPTASGYITVLVSGTAGSAWIELSQSDKFGSYSLAHSNGYAWATIPVVANAQIKIAVLATRVDMARFYPCLGNV